MHTTRINIIVLRFMLLESQEGIVLDPEILLSSSIQIKEDIKTHYTALQPSTEQTVSLKYFEGNLNFRFFYI